MKSKIGQPAAPPAVDSRRWECEDALRVLTAAEQYKKDPKLMADVAKLAAEQKESLARVARMKPKPSSKKK